MTQYAPVFPGFFSQAEPAAAPTPVPASDRRLDVLLARVEAKANTDTSGFSIAAARFILQYLAAHGATSGEKVTDAAKAAGIRTTNDRHFGPVYRRLAKLGVIRKAGYTSRAKGHGSGQAPVWVLGC